MTKWEYSSFYSTWVNLQELNKYGALGWELVSVTENEICRSYIFYFKRPKEDTND